MPIDTSSYYPEVPDPDRNQDSQSLNGIHSSLFGENKPTDNKGQETSEDAAQEKKAPRQVLPFDQKQGDVFNNIDLFCNILSWLLIPLFMPVFGILFIFKLSILDVVSGGLQTAFTFIVLGINFVIPLLFIILLKHLGIIQDYSLNGQKERTIPYIISALCLGGTAWFMATRGAPIWVSMFFTGGAVAALINALINIKWKVSAHAAGIAGIIALLIRLEKDVAVEPQLLVWLLITIGVAGLLGSARIWLGRHTVWQVLAGYMVGFCSVFFMMFIS